MKIRFVNHSGFIVEYKGKKILCDPWLEGSIFINSWKLLSPTLFKYEEFDSIDYIWFSHEHPDHFYPPNLKKIDPTYKKKITVLFQETIDKRVKSHCLKEGFKEVVELHKNQFFEILPDFKVMCEHFEEGDSWICFKTPEQTILNVNDCGIANKSDLDAILAKTGPIDVLMTQFSYAFWAGNPDEVELRQQMADDKLKLVKSQIDALHPKVTIPMASFVYFCHKDNRYLNDRINTAEKTYNFIKENTTSEPVVLYNNEEYEFPEKHDSNASINKYKADLQKILADDTAFITKYETVDKPVLNSEASRFIDDLNKTNSLPLKSALKPTYIYIPDYDETYVLSLKGFKPVTEPHPVPDVELSSELLFWCFKYPFGLDTVQIGGRFRKPRKGNYTAFYNFFRINHLKMRGIDPNAPGTIAGVLVRKITTKIGLNKNR